MHGELVPVPRSAVPANRVFASVGRSTRLGFGIAGLMAHGAHAVVAGHSQSDLPGPPRGLALWAGAALGLAMEAERRALHAADRVVSMGTSVARSTSQMPGVRTPSRRFESWLVRWDTEARLQQRRNRAEADAVLRRAVRNIADAVLAHVDLAHIVEQIPMDEIVERIDVSAILAKIDMNDIVNGVMKDIDLGGIIRESTEGVTAEAVDAVRSQTVKTDLFVSRVVDRVLFRKSPRELTLEAPAPDSETNGKSNGEAEPH